MIPFESLTYATTKQSIEPTLGVENVAFIYGQITTNDITKERLLRTAIAIQEDNESVLFEGAYADVSRPAADIRNDALRIVRKYQHPHLLGSHALAAANLFHGSIDQDGLDFEIKEPFVECDILQLLHINPREFDNPAFFMRHLDAK